MGVSGREGCRAWELRPHAASVRCLNKVGRYFRYGRDDNRTLVSRLLARPQSRCSIRKDGVDGSRKGVRNEATRLKESGGPL